MADTASRDEKAGGRSLLAGGVAAILASTCCLGAPVLVALGFGGAWVGHLERLDAYRPVFMAATVAGLLFAYRGVFRPRQACGAQGRLGQKVVFCIVVAVVGVGLALEAVEKNEAAEKKAAVAAADVVKTKAEPSPGARKQIPELAFVDLNGKPWKLSDHRGQVVLVNYWATWCPPCRKEMPALARLSNRYKSAGLEVVGVNVDAGGLEGVGQFVRKYDISYPVLVRGGGGFSMASLVEKLPTTFLIDKQGCLAALFSGARDEAIFRRELESLLAGA